MLRPKARDDDRRELERKIRTVARGIFVLAANARMLNPLRHGMFAWQLASHKLCRWLVPFAMIGAALGNAALLNAAAFYRLTFAAQLAFYATALTGIWTAAPVLRIPAFLVTSNTAILIAWLRFARGERAASWTPSERLTTLPEIGPR